MARPAQGAARERDEGTLLLVNALYFLFGASMYMGITLSASDGARTTLRLGPVDAARALAPVEPVGAHEALDRAGALARLGRTGLRRVLTTYGG